MRKMMICFEDKATLLFKKKMNLDIGRDMLKKNILFWNMYISKLHYSGNKWFAHVILGLMIFTASEGFSLLYTHFIQLSSLYLQN